MLSICNCRLYGIVFRLYGIVHVGYLQLFMLAIYIFLFWLFATVYLTNMHLLMYFVQLFTFLTCIFSMRLLH
jgi:hypothetical protein